MTLIRNLLGTNPVAGGEPDPEGVSFDGSNDYLSRSSDLSGNADGKTFTFSCWAYKDGINSDYAYDSGNQFNVRVGTLQITVLAYNPAGSLVLNMEVAAAVGMPIGTWNHILISCDMANTANRSVYLNDVEVTMTYITYVNSAINFTNVNHASAARSDSVGKLQGRLAHVFLDYTYRDLSVEANRRLFIDSDGKPASGQASLNPILYLPLKDAATAGSNSGTGGDFTVNGVLDTAGRAPNQDNCVASKGSSNADYVDNSPFSYSNTTTMTLSCNVFWPTLNTSQSAIIHQPMGGRWGLDLYGSSNLLIYFISTAGISWYIQIPAPRDQQFHVAVAYDGDSQSNCKVFINNVDVTSTNTYVQFNAGREVNMTTWPAARVTMHTENTFTIGTSIGEVWMDNTYTDLSTDNPFWNSDTNRPKPVRQVIEETGTTPLIALPLRADDAGNNLGSGGDFTVNSGPFTGARGGSEFWARSAQMLGSNTGNYLNNNSISGLSSVKTFTLMAAVKSLGSSDKQEFFHLYNSSNQDVMKFSYDLSNNAFYVQAYDSSRNLLLSSSGVALTYNTFNIFLISVNLASRADAYINGTAGGSLTIESNANIDFSSVTKCYINAEYLGGDNRASQASSLYFNTSYIDFSQESNRNLFVDQLGYPKDLTPAIDAGDIPDPLIYMKFDDTSALGTNSGTGGDFTVNGTVTAGADVDPNA
jgi:hypothetical protein